MKVPAKSTWIEIINIHSRALATILKLPVIFERVPIRNGLEWSKMVIYLPVKEEVTRQNDGHNES